MIFIQYIEVKVKAWEGIYYLELSGAGVGSWVPIV